MDRKIEFETQGGYINDMELLVAAKSGSKFLAKRLVPETFELRWRSKQSLQRLRTLI